MTSLWYLITYTNTYTNYITIYYSNNHIHVYKSHQHISQLYTCTRHTCTHILRMRTVYNIQCMIYKLHMYLRVLTSVYRIWRYTFIYSYTKVYTPTHIYILFEILSESSIFLNQIFTIKKLFNYTRSI